MISVIFVYIVYLAHLIIEPLIDENDLVLKFELNLSPLNILFGTFRILCCNYKMLC